MPHHRLDPYPIPKDRTPLFVNEPYLIDKTLLNIPIQRDPELQDDNVRIYIPMDLNHDAILRRLRNLIYQYGETTEENELSFRTDVYMIVSQLEIYDQLWYVRHMPENGNHSLEGQKLAADMIALLEAIPDGCAEMFPFELIDELKEEYL